MNKELLIRGKDHDRNLVRFMGNTASCDRAPPLQFTAEPLCIAAGAAAAMLPSLTTHVLGVTMPILCGMVLFV